MWTFFHIFCVGKCVICDPPQPSLFFLSSCDVGFLCWKVDENKIRNLLCLVPKGLYYNDSHWKIIFALFFVFITVLIMSYFLKLGNKVNLYIYLNIYKYIIYVHVSYPKLSYYTILMCYWILVANSLFIYDF